MTYFQRLVLNTLTFMALAVVFPSHIHVSSWVAAVIASFILSFLNMLVKPVLVILSLPLTLVTFGLFSLVVNGFMLILTSAVLGSSSFGFSSFGWAIFASILMSIVNMIISDHNVQKY